MSADRAREAAKVLRELAEAAEDSLPWDYWDYETFTRTGLDGPEADYIATMTTTVGLALANLLDVCANYYDLDVDPECDECLAADALADAILGSQS